jgi:hypothetical protein
MKILFFQVFNWCEFGNELQFSGWGLLGKKFKELLLKK